MKKNEKIAIAMFNMIQYYSVEPGLDELIKQGYDIDVYIPDFVPEDMTADSGYLDIYNATYDHIKDKGYNIKRKYNGEEYKVVLTPYYVKNFFDFKTKYNIKYQYGVGCKPNITMKVPDNIDYDANICYTTWEREYLQNYGMAFDVGNTKYYKFKKNPKRNGKPNLLYLPTYGSVSSILNIKAFEQLKDKYNLIIKIHHNTSYLKSEGDKLKGLEDVFDEIYEQDHKLIDLLASADFVITDNSGAIFEALSAEVPVAMFADEVDLSIGEMKAIQHKLVDMGVILSTSDPNKIIELIDKTNKPSQLKKQLDIKKELFPFSNDDLVKRFVEVIDGFVKDKYSQDYFAFHNYFKEQIKQYMKNDKEFYEQLVESANRIKYLEQLLEASNNNKRSFFKRAINKIKRIIKGKK